MADAQRSPQQIQAKELNAVMSHMEAHRVVSCLNKCIERLQLLSILSYDTFEAGEEGGQQGVEGSSGVGAILESQKKLEKRYEELLKATATVKQNPLNPTLDLTCFTSIDDREHRRHKEELEKVSKDLKEYSRDLCRQLKENPNDTNNWNKVATGRSELIALLHSCIRELAPAGVGNAQGRKGNDDRLFYADDNVSQAESQRSGRPSAQNQTGQSTYEAFAVKVIEDQNEQIWADDIVKREKETNQNVKTLQADVANERGLKERELSEREQQLSELKIKVRKLRNESAENYERRKGETEARAEAQARRGKNRQRELKEQIEMLKERIEVENRVHKELKMHLSNKIEDITGSTRDWTEKQTERQRHMEEKLTNDKKAKETLEMRLLESQQHCHDAKTKRDNRREMDEKERALRKREEDVEAAKREAATRLQAAFKACLVRMTLKATGKKGKKGKKK